MDTSGTYQGGAWRLCVVEAARRGGGTSWRLWKEQHMERRVEEVCRGGGAARQTTCCLFPDWVGRALAPAPARGMPWGGGAGGRVAVGGWDLGGRRERRRGKMRRKKRWGSGSGGWAWGSYSVMRDELSLGEL
jgi:hypothetical protein